MLSDQIVFEPVKVLAGQEVEVSGSLAQRMIEEGQAVEAARPDPMTSGVYIEVYTDSTAQVVTPVKVKAKRVKVKKVKAKRAE